MSRWGNLTIPHPMGHLIVLSPSLGPGLVIIGGLLAVGAFTILLLFGWLVGEVLKRLVRGAVNARDRYLAAAGVATAAATSLLLLNLSLLFDPVLVIYGAVCVVGALTILLLFGWVIGEVLKRLVRSAVNARNRYAAAVGLATSAAMSLLMLSDPKTDLSDWPLILAYATVTGTMALLGARLGLRDRASAPGRRGSASRPPKQDGFAMRR